MKIEWKDMFPPVDGSFERSMDRAFEAIRKENRPMKKKVHIGIVLAAALMLLSVTALAVSGSQLFRKRTEYADPILPLNGADELIVSNLGSAENELVTMTVEEAVYDGQGMIVLTRLTPKDPDHCALFNLMLSDTPEDVYLSENIPVEVSEDVHQIVGDDGKTVRIKNETAERELSVNGEAVPVPESREAAEAADLPVYLENGVLYYTDVMEYRVTGRRDGRQLIRYALDLTSAAGDGDIAGSPWDDLSLDAEEQPDGSVLVWLDAVAGEPLPETAEMLLRGTICVDDRQIPLDGIPFTMKKAEPERIVRYEPEATDAIGSRITVRGVQAVLTKVRAYLTVDYDYLPAENEIMGITFHAYAPDGTQIAIGSGTNRCLNEETGTFREQLEMQSFDDIPETLKLEAYAIDIGAAGSCVCRAVP